MRVAFVVVFALIADNAWFTQAQTGNWTKILMTDAVNKGAVCLDGSPGGFYIRHGDPDNWIIFHQGGFKHL